jgi:thermitase
MQVLLDYLYPVSYLFSLASLVLWFFMGGRPRMSKNFSILFLSGFFIYLFSLSFSSGTTQYKLLILFRDMAVMIVCSQIFLLARKRLLVSFVLGAGALLAVYFSYFNVLFYTFPQISFEMTDPDAEFLASLEEPEGLAIIAQSGEGQIEVSPAFSMDDPGGTLLDNYIVINVLNDRSYARKKFFKRLSGMDMVEWIEPNEIIPLEEPVDREAVERTGKTPVLNDPGISHQWHFDPLDMDALHRHLLSSGLKPVRKSRIAIIDTGVDAKHEDLSGNYRSVDPKSDADPQGHGTHCAGIAAAVSNNSIGIASAAPSVDYIEVTGFRVTNNFGIITQKAIIQAMIDAADNGVDVLSLSLGGRSDHAKQKAYNAAVRYVNDKGAVVVVAAGNASENAKYTAPANAEGVIAVAALDQDLNKAGFSNSVQDLEMALAAPGVNIYSTIPGDRYASFNGTSMATPMVSGTIAMMKAFYPEISTKEAYYLLEKTGKKTRDGSLTGKLIQPFSAMQEILD